MAESFYNPYQFIPVTGKVKVNGEDKDTLLEPFAKIKSGESRRGIRHDLWDGQRKSGRIVCSLTLETPTVVGNQHEPLPSGETLVKPYQFPDGEYAIPANSLRGMISSTAEALSQSALRVLEEKRYSVRKEVGKGLSAIGYIRKVEHGKGKSTYYLRPLSLPAIPKVRLGDRIKYLGKWINLFGGTSSLSHWLSAYVDRYYYNNYKEMHEYADFLDKDKLCNSFCKLTFYYAKLHKTLESCLLGKYCEIDNEKLYCKEIRKDGVLIGHSVLGQRIANSDIITQEKFDELSENQRSDYVRGVLFVFGIEGRESEVPKTKRHERFIPTPRDKKINDKELEISSSVIDEFLNLVKERNESDKALPYLPHGYEKIPNRKGWLCNGDMVYFDINDQGQVTEISYSSIWRKSVDGSIHGAFKKINRNLLPWGSKDRDGQKPEDGLTPAEWLFGVVEGGEEKDKATRKPESLNLASRVRFFDARSLEPIEVAAEIPLKILSSPKPPSPAMYFKTGPLKKDLSMDIHEPNGRKYYLPHSKAHASSEPWITQNKKDSLDQKCRCTPLPAKASFYFHIDFDNLSDAELELLLKAIKPAEGFRHRLGLGKPLGLGSVRADIQGVFYLNRIQRYGEDALAKTGLRYSNTSNQQAWDESLAKEYPAEYAAIAKPVPPLSLHPEEKLIDQTTLDIINLLGKDPERRKPKLKIHYPLAADQKEGCETDGFKWFANNDDKRNERQILKPVEIGQPLPALKPNTEFNRGR